MPSLIYVLFKSTEPDMDDYLTLNLQSQFSKAGFSSIIEDTTSVSRRVITVGTKK